MNSTRLPLLAVSSLSLALVVASGCEMSYFAADIQASEVCVIDMSVAFPGVPSVGGPGEVGTRLETAIGEDDLGVRLSEDLELDVSVLSVALAPSTGVSDLGFVDALAVTLGAEESEVPKTLVVELHGSDRLSDGALYAEPDTAVDVTAHIRAGELIMDFELAGDLPESDWEANIDLCLSAGASYVAPL